MFLCDACHDKNKHVDLFRSLGKCESCGKVKACIDCHYATCNAPKKTDAK